MKQEVLEILVWKHFNQEAMADLDQAKSPRARREVIKTVLGLEKKDWRNKGTLHHVNVMTHSGSIVRYVNHLYSVELEKLELFFRTKN